MSSNETTTQQSSKRRRGKIDVHHHNFPPDLMLHYDAAALGYVLPTENLPWTPAVSFAAMDALGVAFTVLSAPDAWPNAAAYNRRTAEICKAHPGRFGFFACLPDLRKMDEVLAEIDYVLDVLGANGFSMVSSYGDGPDAKYVGDDAFAPIWAALDRRGALVFLHGAQTPSSTPHPHALLGLPVVAVPHETYKAAAHLVVSGRKRACPRVRVVLSHLGGATVALAPRVAGLVVELLRAGTEGKEGRGKEGMLSAEEILADFKTFYLDTALAVSDAAMRAAETFVGHERIVFGSDFPAISTYTAQWYKKQLEDVYDGRQPELNDIFTNNALALMPELRAFVEAEP